MLYKLVFDFIIPVYRASKRMKEQVTNMHQKMQEQQHTPSGKVHSTHNENNTTPAGEKDYIDFEEVK